MTFERLRGAPARWRRSEVSCFPAKKNAAAQDQRQGPSPSRQRETCELLHALHHAARSAPRCSPSGCCCPASSPTTSCPWRRCPRWTSRSSWCSPAAPAPDPGNDGHLHRRRRSSAISARSPDVTELTSTSAIGSTVIVMPVRRRPRHRGRGARRAGGDHRRHRRPCRPTCRRGRTTASSTRPTRRSSRSPSPPTRCRRARCTTPADTILAQRLSQLRRREPGADQRRRESRPCACGSTRVALRAASLAGKDVFTAIRNANVTEPTGSFEGPRPRAEDIAVNGQMTQAERVCRAGDQVAERLGPAPVGRGERDRWRGQQPAGGLGRPAAPAILLYISKVAGGQRDRHGGPREGGAAALARLDAAGHQGARSCRTAPPPSAPAWTTCRSRC